MDKDNAAVAAPTGCYKCGKPGHWSRDCPSSAPNPNSSRPPSSSAPAAPSKVAEKPKKAPRVRPKLTPELLLSEDGLGYVLRHFPRAFKYRGRGHEISDLENLIGLYREWHSHILPYYPFEHFVHKVEQVAATKRVKMCLGELREKVARGGDPTKWRESPIVNDDDDDDINNENEAKDSEGLFDNQEEASLKNNGADDIEEDMLQEVYEKATEEEPLMNLQSDSFTIGETVEGVVNQEEPNTSNSNETLLTEQQRARMEANRLKALERAAAKARSSPTA